MTTREEYALSGTSEASESPSKRLRIEATEKSFRCQICNRMYERADHLNRHLDSHRNERSFRCPECPAAFNRKDLLRRHQASHAKHAASGHTTNKRLTERATSACASCVASKVKCDNTRPCKRCRSKDIICTSRNTPSQGSTSGLPDSAQDETEVFGQMQAHAHEDVSHSPICVDAIAPLTGNYELVDDSTIQMQAFNEPALGQDLRNFFEQIMVPEFDSIGSEYVQPPPDLTAWMDEVEYFGELDLFGSNFVPSMDQIFEPQLGQQQAVVTPRSVDGSGTAPSVIGNGRVSTTQRRHLAYQNSPWSLFPTHNQYVFSENESNTIDGQNLDLAASPHQPYESDVIIPGRLSWASRDRIFKLVTSTAQAHISIPSFPDAECLDKLIKVGIAKRTENDAWIHPYTFDSNNALPELLVALVAAGCICFGIPAVNRTGLVLQEISRVALNKLAEKDNSTTQNLQYLQASMLWIDIGAFCGYKRKMVVAESSLQALVTALRHAGRFGESQTQAIVPPSNDQQQELDQKWRRWVERESYKRLIYHLWDHDIDMALLKHRQPLISYAELSSSLPASRSLWLAPTAEAWRLAYTAESLNDHRSSLRDLLKDGRSLSSISTAIDKHIARSAYLHGMAAQIWEFSQQAMLLGESSDRSSQLWLQLRQENLYQQLQRVDCSLDTSLAGACVLHQFLQMYVHANLETVTRFAGRCGEEEAHRAYTHLQSWSVTKEARIAISHAGRVLHNARMIRPYQFRGPDSFMVYYAIMVLWTYSMMSRDRVGKSVTPEGLPATSYNDTAGAIVFLDSPDTNEDVDRDAFISSNRGTPGLHIISAHHLASEGAPVPDAVCDLRYPSQVMEVGTSLLRAAHPGVQLANRPPLLRAFSSLMEELGKL